MGRPILSAQEVATFRARGQLTPRHRLPDDCWAGYRGHRGADRREPGVRPEQLVGAHVAASADTGVRGVADLLE